MSLLKPLLAAVLTSIVLSVPAQPARAALFTYSAPCTVDCASLGLVNGDPVSATIGIADASLLPDALLDLTDITSFALTLAGETFALGDLALAFLRLDATATAAIEFFLIAENANGAIFFAIGNPEENGFFVGIGELPPAFGGPGTIQLVAEPLTLVLLSTGLVLIGVRPRRARPLPSR